MIYGEEYLYKTAQEQLLTALFPQAGESLRNIAYEALDGLDQNISAAVEKLNTYSLLSGAKVVALTDARVFESKQDRRDLLAKAKQAFDSDDIKKAVRYFTSVMGLGGLTYEDFGSLDQSQSSAAEVLGVELPDSEWINNIVSHCVAENVPIPKGGDGAEVLEAAISKGFPSSNRLIITTGLVDKRRRLYKTIQEKGVIIDCSVPKGERKADRAAQDKVLGEQMQAILGKHGKTMAKAAYGALCEMTGFDLRTFANSLEKLVTYIGDRPAITAEDVAAVMKRTKTDPIYELTNAVADRNLTKALFFIESLLKNDIHPLQVFTAIANQIRRLLLAKSFVTGPCGSSWKTGATYNYFRTNVMPDILEHDQRLVKHITDQEAKLTSMPVSEDNGQAKAAQPKKTKQKTATDLIIAKNPHNTYPIYQLLLKSDKFEQEELIRFFAELNQADLKLKSTAQNPKVILEHLIFTLTLQKPEDSRS